MIKVENAMMISVGFRGSRAIKHILVQVDGEDGRFLTDIAKEALEKYKESQQNKDVYLIDYSWYGDVEVLNA